MPTTFTTRTEPSTTFTVRDSAGENVEDYDESTFTYDSSTIAYDGTLSVFWTVRTEPSAPTYTVRTEA